MTTLRHEIMVAARQHACVLVLRVLRRVLRGAIVTTQWSLKAGAVLSQWAGDDPALPPADAQVAPARLATGGRHSLRKPAPCASIRSRLRRGDT